MDEITLPTTPPECDECGDPYASVYEGNGVYLCSACADMLDEYEADE